MLIEIQMRKMRTGCGKCECLNAQVLILGGLARVGRIEKLTCDQDLKEVRRESCWLKSYQQREGKCKFPKCKYTGRLEKQQMINMTTGDSTKGSIKEMKIKRQFGVGKGSQIEGTWKDFGVFLKEKGSQWRVLSKRGTLSNIFLRVTSGHCVENRLQEGRYRSMVTSWGLSLQTS